MFVGKKIESNTVKLMSNMKKVNKKAVFEEELAQISHPSSIANCEVKEMTKQSSSLIKSEKYTVKVQKQPAQYSKIDNQSTKINKSKSIPLNNIHIQNKINIKNTEKRSQDKIVNKTISKIQKKESFTQSKQKNDFVKPKQHKSSILSIQKKAELLQANRQSEKNNCLYREPLIQQDELIQIDEEDQVQFARQFLPNPLPHNKIFSEMIQFQDSLLEPWNFSSQQHKNEFIPQEYSFNQPSEDLQLNMQLFELNAEELLALDYLTI